MMFGSNRLSSLLTRAVRTRVANVKQPSRNSGGYVGYREPNYQPNRLRLDAIAAVMGAYLWWWLIYNSYHNMHFVVGHFEFMGGKGHLWQDEELGIPDDEEGVAPVIDKVRTTRIPGCINRHHNFNPFHLKKFFGDEGMWKF